MKYQGIGGKAVVMEYKVARTQLEISGKLDEAKTQIYQKKYAEGLLAEGFQYVICYAVVFYRKDCLVEKI